MSITAIRAQLQTNLGQITGISTAFYPAPSASPAALELPCIIIEKGKPLLSVTAETMGDMVRYTWHFNIKFIFKELGNDTYDQWMLGMEPFYKRMINALMGDVKLHQSSSGLVFSPREKPIEFSEGVVEYLGAQYWGFETSFDFWEKVNTTIA